MKTFRFLMLFLFGYSVMYAQQPCSNKCTFIKSIDLSTGYDNSSNNIIPQWGSDDDWILTNVPTAMATPGIPRAAFVIDNAWGPVLPNSAWVSGTGTSNWGGQLVPTVNNVTCVPNNQGPIQLERKFCVCRRTQLTFNLQILVDNYLRIDFIDGNNVTTTIYDQCWPGLNTMPGVTANIGNPCCNTTSSFDNSIESITTTINASPGECRLVLYVYEEGSTTTGVNISGSVSGNNLAPISCCATQGLISGRKIDDANCNGVADPGEVGLPGWNIDLMSGTTIVASTTTDPLGYYSFGYQNFGNYTVVETPQAGWTPTSPVGGSTSITLNAANLNQYVEFLNCESGGEYCCPGVNLIVNGNFESGDVGFSSNYASKAAGQAVNPGEYSVIDYTTASTVCSDWDVEDHTHCITGSNSKIMVVNGKSLQTTNVGNVIWQSGAGIPVEQDSIYKFCAYVQHLEQCCFDVTPQIAVQYRENGAGAWYTLVPTWQTINYTGPATSSRCEWEEIGGTFTGNGGTVEFRFLLNEIRNGDGNDLAIDDISLHKLSKPDFYLSHSFAGSPKVLTASQFLLSNSDDLLPSPECNYWWLVAEVNSFNPLSINWTTAMFGGNLISPNWGLTTTFPTYAGGSPNGNFQTNKQYIAVLNIYDCDCYAPHWEAQGVWSTNQRSLGTKELNLTASDRRSLQANLHKELNKRKLSDQVKDR